MTMLRQRRLLENLHKPGRELKHSPRPSGCDTRTTFPERLLARFLQEIVCCNGIPLLSLSMHAGSSNLTSSSEALEALCFLKFKDMDMML